MPRHLTIFSKVLLSVTLTCFLSCENNDEQPGTSTQNLTFSIPANFLQPNEEIWIFITDSNGELLGAQPGADNTVLAFEFPGFPNNGKVTLHQLTRLLIEDDVPYTSTRIFSYADLSPGNYRLKPAVRTAPEPSGWHDVTVQNMTSGYNQIWAPTSSGLVSTVAFTPGGGTKTIGVAMIENPTNQLYKVFNSSDRSVTPKYIQRNGVEFDDDVIVNFSEMVSADAVNITLDKSYNSLSQSTRIFTTIDRARTLPWETFVSVNQSQMKLFYPGNDFDYLTELTLTNPDRSISYGKIGGPVTSVKTLDADITSLTFDEGELKISATGSFDYLQARSVESWSSEAGDHALSWFFYSNRKSTSTAIIPQIPAAIISQYPELSTAVIKFDAANAEDLVGIDGYEDYIDKLLKTDESIYKFYSERLTLGVNF